jgi:putative salt-induced outer membrane protein YdiY
LVDETAQTVTIEHPTLGRLIVSRAALAAIPTGQAAAMPMKLKWRRQIEFGYAQEAGRTAQQNLTARVQLDGQGGADTYHLTARVQQAETNGIDVADQRAADFRWRHEITPRLFTQTLTTWTADPVRSIDQSVEQQVGGGLKLMASGGSTANVGLGAAVRYQDRAGTGAETALLGTVFQDYAHAWSGGVRFSEEASVALASDRPFSPAAGAVGAPPVPADGGNYRVRFNTLLQGRVTAQVNFNLRYDYDYDRSVPDPAGRVDRRLTTSLGYTW